MGINKYNNPIKGCLACKQCHTYYLLELLTTEPNILLRKYCFCGESTTQINNNMKLELIQEFSFFNDYKCKCILGTEDNVAQKKAISKFCNDCNEYLCKDCFKIHNHTNLIAPNLLLINCKYHQNKKLIGFCRNCTKPLCQECANNSHRNHDIRYAKQLNKLIIEKYQKNLLKAISEFTKLIKQKYGQNMELTISNLSSSSKDLPLIDFEDKQILISLEILQTILDLYIYHNSNGSLNYQLVANILKHINFEIIKLTDKGNISEDFNNIGHKNIDDKINKNITIHLQIDLKDEEKRVKKINILSFKKLEFNDEATKMMILKNGDLAFNCYRTLTILKNLKDISEIEPEGRIDDFIQLENENLAVLSSFGKCGKVIFYYLEIFDIKNNYEKIVEINLQTFGRNEGYSKILNIDNTFFLLSYSKKEKKIIITYIKNQDYKEEKLLDLKGDIGNIIYINGYFIISTIQSSNKLIIYFYDFQSKNIEKSLSLSETDDKCLNFFSSNSILNTFVINNEKILLSTELYGLIINVKTKEIESKIKNFKNIYCLENLNGYLLAGSEDSIISQINTKLLKISNNFIINFDRKEYFRIVEIVSIIDIGNNQFLVFFNNDGLYLFNYK